MTTSTSTDTGRVEAIAYRPADGQTMQLIPECAVLAGRGLTLENRRGGKREITLLSAESWADVCHELGTQIPWHFRRANLLIRGINLADMIGKTLTIGPVRVLVHGETRPCGIMDAQYPGLKTALIADARGGVHAQVLADAVIRVGDPVRIED